MLNERPLDARVDAIEGEENEGPSGFRLVPLLRTLAAEGVMGSAALGNRPRRDGGRCSSFFGVTGSNCFRSVLEEYAESGGAAGVFSCAFCCTVAGTPSGTRSGIRSGTFAVLSVSDGMRSFIRLEMRRAKPVLHKSQRSIPARSEVY